MEGVEEQPVVYSFVSCSMRQAVDRTGVSEATLHKAISDGWLVAHYVGERGGKIVIRAQDLDEWVKSLPTESRREQEWRSIYH
jgi:excisionase family DNA binding protein